MSDPVMKYQCETNASGIRRIPNAPPLKEADRMGLEVLHFLAKVLKSKLQLPLVT